MKTSLIIPLIGLQIYNIKSRIRDGHFLRDCLKTWKWLYIVIYAKPSAVAVLTDLCSFKRDPHLPSRAGHFGYKIVVIDVNKIAQKWKQNTY